MASLSVVLPALGGLETVRAALDRWEAQTRREELELIVLCPDPADVDGLRTIDSRGLLLNEARARGIREATAEHVFLAEDHCVPDASWAEAILPQFAGAWYGIGSRLAPGDTTDTRSQAAFLIAYGEWMAPLATGPVATLPGHNVVLRRAPLLDLGGELEELLLVAAFLTRRLGRGGKLFVVAEAAMTHYDVTALRRQLAVFATVGRSFGAVRTRHSSLVGRVAYACAFPLVAAAHWARALAQYRRAGRANGLRPTCLAAAALFAVVWALGEARGALLGPRRIAGSAEASETKPVTADALEPKT